MMTTSISSEGHKNHGMDKRTQYLAAEKNHVSPIALQTDWLNDWRPDRVNYKVKLKVMLQLRTFYEELILANLTQL